MNNNHLSINVLIVEDEPVIASDIEMTLSGEDYTIAGIAYTSTKALDMLHKYKLDVVLLDIAIKGDKDGIDLATIINEKYKIPFIYVTSFADRETLDRAKATMPYGYIVKPFKDRDIISAIEMAVYRHASEHNHQLPSREEHAKLAHLTPGEYQVMKCVWEGNTNQQVAEQLNISINTVKTHLKNCFSKLDVNSRSEAIAVIRDFA
jgi:DNA-binding NarL/FixJ family response regulator